MGARDQTSWWAPAVHVRRRGRAMALCVLAAVAVGTTACAQEADPADVAVGDVKYEATPAFPRASAERSQSQPYRMEMRESRAGATR